MATDHNFIVKNGLEVGGVLIVNSSGQLAVANVTSNLNFYDSVRADFGNSQDLRLYHNGSTNNSNIENYTGGLFITNYANDEDIVFRSDDGSGGVAEYFRLDGGNGYLITSKHNQHLDNVKSMYGGSNDLQIYHDGSNSYIRDAGTGNLRIDATDFYVRNSAGTQLKIGAVDSGAVNLYYAGSKKFETTSSGVDITGNVVADGLNVASDTDTISTLGRAKIGAFVTDYAYFSHIDNATSTSYALNQNSTGATSVNAKTGASVSLKINNVNKLTVDSSGNTTFAGEIYAKDSNSTTDPTITFTGHTDSGFSISDYGNGTDQINIIRDGGAMAHINQAGVMSNGNVYTGYTSEFRNFGGTWKATTGTTGNGFEFHNSADNVTPLKITSDGKLYLTNQNNSYLEHTSQGAIKNTTSSGYTTIGAENSSFTHIQTDRPKFYFNKGLTVNEGIVSSYDEDLILRRSQTSTSGQLTLSRGKFTGGSQSASDLLNSSLILGGFHANSAFEEASGHFYIPGLSPNQLAGSHRRHTVTITKNGTTYSPSSLHAMFSADGTNTSFGHAAGSTDTIVITITGIAMSYGQHVGVQFGHPTFRAKDIEIEVTTDNGSNWTSVYDVTNFPYATVAHYHGGGGTATNGIRYTFTNFNNTGMRINQLFCYDYSENEIYFAERNQDQTIRGNWTFTDNYWLKFGSGGDLQLYHDGTDSLIRNYTSDLYIQNDADDKDIIIRTDNGSGGIAEYMRFDGSDTLTRAYKTILFQDSVKASFGNSEDMRIKHDGSNGTIDNYTGDLLFRNNVDDKDIILQSDDGSGGLADYIRLDGSHGQIKLNKQTIFPDSVEATFGTSGDAGIYHNGTHLYIDEKDAGRIFIRSSNEVRLNKYTGEYMIRAIADGAVNLYHDNSLKLETKSDGVDITGELQADSLDIDGVGDISGNLTIGGNLTVNGTTVTNSATNTTIEDALIELGSGNTGSNSNDLGLILERGTSGNNAFIGFDESDDQIAFALTTATGSSTGNLAFSSFLPIKAAGITGTSLDINGNADISGNLVIQGADVDITANIRHAGDTDTYFGFHTNNQWRVVTGGAERIEVSNSGIIVNDGGADYDFRVESNNDGNNLFSDGGNDRIGIGTSTPSTKLDVRGPGATLAKFVANSSSDDALVRIIGGNYNTEKDARLFLGEGDAYGMTIEYDGVANIGYIGMNDNVDPTGAYSKRIGMSRGGTEVFFTAGNVGIGTSTPTDKLHVAGNINIVSNKIYNGSANNSAGLELGGSRMNLHGYNGIRFYASAAGIGSQTERMRITNAGKVGIGTTAPDQKFHVEFTNADTSFSGGSGGDWGSDGIRIENASTTANTMAMLHLRNYDADLHIAGIRQGSNDSDLGFFFEGSEKVRFTNDGKVGIGTSTPYKKLEVVGDIQLDATDANIWIKSGAVGTNGFINWTFNTDGTVYNKIGMDYDTRATTGFHIDAGYPITIDASASGGKAINFDIGGVTKAVIDGTGNFGIGTDSPNRKFVVRDSGAQMSLLSDTDGSSVINFGDTADDNAGRIHYNNDTDAMFIRTATVDRIAILSSGNVGVGTTSPNYKLDVNGETRIQNQLRIYASTPSIRFIDSDDNSDGYIQANAGTLRFYADDANEVGASLMTWNIDGSEKMRLRNNGFLGIGATTPLDLLHLKSSTTDARAVIDGHTAFDAELKFAENGTVQYTIGHDAATNNFVIGTTNVDTDPRFIITTNGFIRMNHNNAWDGLGTLTIKQKADDQGLGLIDDTGTNTFKIYNNGTASHLYYNVNNPIIFSQLGGERMRINSSGDVGIGTTDPKSKVHVFETVNNSSALTTLGTTADGATVRIENNSTTTGSYASLFLRADTGDIRIAAVKKSSTSNDADLVFVLDDASESTSVERMRIVGDSGNIGIGDNAPSSKLTVKNGASGNVASFTSGTSTSGDYQGITLHAYHVNGVEWYGSAIRNILTASNPNYLNPRLGFFTQDHDTYLPADRTEKMSILDNGRVGIGTTSPSSLLHLVSASSPKIQITDTTQTTTLQLYAQDSNTHVGNATAHDLVFDTNNTERMRIRNSTGAVGIGTNSPSQKLDVRGGNVMVGGFGGGADYGLIFTPADSASYWHIYNDTGGELVFGRNITIGSSEHARFDNNGNFGIGTDSPARKFVVRDSGAQMSLLSDTDGSSVINFGDTADDNAGRIHYNNDTDAMFIRTATVDRITILSSGNVGVGTTTPAFKLDVNGNVRANGYIRVNSGGSFRLYNSAGNAWVELFFDETNNMLQVQRGFKPSGDSQLDLGTNTVRWRNVYADTYYGSGANLTGVLTGAQDLYTGSSHPGNSFIDFDDDAGVGGATNSTSLVSVGSMNFIMDSNNNGSDQFNWMHNNTAPSSAASLMTLDSSGNLDVTGQLSATTKSFDIEHPTKEGKRLHHGVLEGPEHAVYIRGRTKGSLIQLPEYWTGLVHEDTITVQLTPIGKSSELYVKDIADNKVLVSNDTEYFYFIQAERKDVERFEVEYEV